MSIKQLVIVESPAKTKKLETFLGSSFKVVPSLGHIRDLPKSGLGVNVENNFTPEYVVPKGREDVVRKLKKEAKNASAIYLATDPDREGEAIAWHVGCVINGGVELHEDQGGNYLVAKKIKNSKNQSPRVYRVSFNSITKNAVLDAFDNPRKLDVNLIDAQQARRILDRLVGYKLSPLLWEKIRYGLSAGRVQSVAVRFVVEREEEIKNFKEEPYFEIFADFTSNNMSKSQQLRAKLVKIGKEAIYQKETFKLFATNYTVTKTTISTKNKADDILQNLKLLSYNITTLDQKEVKSMPSAPFVTSTLQQTASARLGYSPKRTMQIAQKLYENGHITYMRTDSVYMNPRFVRSLRSFIKKEYGDKYLLPKERFFKNKKGVKTQEAHEAIRPSKLQYEKKVGTPQEQKLYDLIFARTVATQMKPAIYLNTKVEIADPKDMYTFEAKGSVLKFDGFLKVYKSSKKNEEIPAVKLGEKLNLKNVASLENQLTPPPRYNESSLIRELEKFGIGRPSTYAPIISTIQTRGYVKKVDKKLYPTDNGIVVNKLLVNHFPQIVDVDFTAEMEESLDDIAEGKQNWRRIVRDFYEPFEKLINYKKQEIKKEDVVVLEKTNEACPECKKGKLVVKLGKYGKFLSCDRYPECKYAKPFEEDKSDLSEEEIQQNEELEKLTKEPCPNCGGQLVVKSGRFGKFVACKNYPKCKYTKSVREKTNMKCPECGDEYGGEIVVKRTRSGKPFYGCSRYPDCTYATWKKPKIE